MSVGELGEGRGRGEGGDGGGCGEREERGGEAWPIRVRSTHPLTTRAATWSKGSAKRTLMIGVATLLAALMISLMRGTPRVMFMLATPAKWKVLRVICVPGSPMDCAPVAPTALPGSMRFERTFRTTRTRNSSSSLRVTDSDVHSRSNVRSSGACASLGRPNRIRSSSRLKARPDRKSPRSPRSLGEN